MLLNCRDSDDDLTSLANNHVNPNLIQRSLFFSLQTRVPLPEGEALHRQDRRGQGHQQPRVQPQGHHPRKPQGQELPTGLQTAECQGILKTKFS